MIPALWALIALPALVGAVLLVWGRRAQRAAPTVALATSAVVLALAITVAIGWPTASAPFLPVAPFTLVVDGLAAVVAVTVAAVTLLVLLAATTEIGEGRARFFGLMLLFLAAVLLTVTAATLVALLLAWEIMGATSYALIAHHWRSDRHVGSGTTAFLVTRTGDLGLYLAAGAALAAGAGLGLGGLDTLPGPWLHVAAAGVLAAAFGKAAQLPFTFWLSRAMDGPSTVSALLHSAAMVAMGSYLLLRLAPLLGATGWAAPAAAWGGAVTALVLGAVAVAQSDLKQLLAASTSSQLGFVILGAGTAAHGGVIGGTGQLVAHAAVKSALFLAAGAWLVALGTRQMAGLRGAARTYPWVGTAFAVGAVALAGVPPLSLWASKDQVLSAAKEQSVALYGVGLAAAVLSAVYAGKALGLVAKPLPADPEAGYDIEQAGTRRVGALAKAPLAILATAAAGLGVLALPGVTDALARVLGRSPAGSIPLWEILLSAGLALGFTGFAVIAPGRLPAPAWLRGWLGLEAAAHAVVVRPVLALADVLARFDDGALHGGAVRGVATGARRLGQLARRPQTGQLHQYYAQVAAVLAAAVVLLLVVR